MVEEPAFQFYFAPEAQSIGGIAVQEFGIGDLSGWIAREPPVHQSDPFPQGPAVIKRQAVVGAGCNRKDAAPKVS